MPPAQPDGSPDPWRFAPEPAPEPVPVAPSPARRVWGPPTAGFSSDDEDEGIAPRLEEDVLAAVPESYVNVETPAPVPVLAVPKAHSDGFDSMISPMTSAERAHFATLSKADQEMARVMVRLRHRIMRGYSKTLAGVYATFDGLADIKKKDFSWTPQVEKERKHARMRANPLVESFLVYLGFAPAPAPAPPPPRPAPPAATARIPRRLPLGA